MPTRHARLSVTRGQFRASSLVLSPRHFQHRQIPRRIYAQNKAVGSIRARNSGDSALKERENDSRTRTVVMSSRSVSLSREAPSLSREIYTSPSFDMLALGPAESDETPRQSFDLNELNRVCSWRPPSPRKTGKKCRPVSSKRMIGLPRSDSLVESKVRVGGFQRTRTSNEIPAAISSAPSSLSLTQTITRAGTCYRFL